MKEIMLNHGRITIVDDEDFEWLNSFKWYAQRSGNTSYVHRMTKRVNGKQGLMVMHRIILNVPPSFETDHINGDGLDNRRENLRVVTHRENAWNKTHIIKRSEFPGVDWVECRKKWRAKIRLGGEARHLGYFTDELEAATMYRVACIALAGEMRGAT